MNNPEKVVHAKKYPQTSFYRSLFAFYEQLLKVRVAHEKKTSLFLSGTRGKTEKMPSTRRERKSYIRCARAPSLFIFGFRFRRVGCFFCVEEISPLTKLKKTMWSCNFISLEIRVGISLWSEVQPLQKDCIIYQPVLCFHYLSIIIIIIFLPLSHSIWG